MADQNPAPTGLPIPTSDRPTASPTTATTSGDPGVVDRENAPPVDLANDVEAEAFADRLSVTRAQLDEAVSAVGADVHAVQVYLRGQGGGD